MYSATLATSAIVLVALVSVQQATGNPTENVDQVVFSKDSHNLKLGHRRNGDRVLDHTQIKIDHNLLRWVEHDYVFPRDQATSNKVIKITSIEVANLLSDEDGGYPTVTKGGIGSSNVHIHLESRWNKGIDFSITVYGKWVRRNNLDDTPLMKIIYV